MMSNSNKKLHFASLVIILLSVSIASSVAIVIPNNASAQQDQEQRGLLGGLEREQSDEAIPGQQQADVGGSDPLNRTIVGGDEGSAQPSACAPTQTGGAGGGNQTEAGGVTTNATTAAGGAGNQSTASSPTQLIEQACMALQAGDIQGAMMQLNLALGQLREGGGMQDGGTTTTDGATGTTTGPGGIGTDDPGATDNPFSDLT